MKVESKEKIGGYHMGQALKASGVFNIGYVNPTTGQPEQVQGQGGAPFSVPIGFNLSIGTQTVTFASSAAVQTAESATFTLPTVSQPFALYLVVIDVPANVGSSFTFTFNNAINLNGTTVYATVTSLTAGQGTTISRLVQGWMLGDAPAQVVVTNAQETSASATITIQVREV